MASNHGLLFKEAVVLFDKFSVSKQVLDDFLEDASKDLQNMNNTDKQFILDVVSGCIEHKKLLDAVIGLFYAHNGTYLSRRDRTQFVIICYLTTFLLDELGLQCFSNIVKSLDIKKMHAFLSFFFTYLTTWIQDKWSSIYDVAFVQKQWIDPLLRWRPDIDSLIDQLAAKISNEGQVKKAPAATTKPQEFSLTKPKPRPLPMPELIPQQEKHKPVPDTTYKAPREIEMIKVIKQRNRQKTEELLYEANMKRFQCVNQQTSEHTRKAISQIKTDLDSKLRFDSFRSSGLPPTHKTNNWPTKLNSAAILRQGAFYDRKVEEALQRIEHLAEGALEPSSFLQWQKEMHEKDLQEELAKIERRRLEGRISYEEAAMARTHIMERNQKAAQLKREETEQLMRRYAEKRLQEEREMRNLVQQVAEGHKNSKEAKIKLQKLKQTIVKEVSEHNQELLRQALEEAQAELCRKYEIIREIHAIESVPHIRVKYFDDTETEGHGLLVEMSLAELKERLALLKERQQSEQQGRRKQILDEKESKKQYLLEQMDAINLTRKALAQAATLRKEERKARLDFKQEVVTHDETILALKKKLQEKQQERQSLKQSERTKFKTPEQAAAHTNETFNQQSLKKKSWLDLEQCLERDLQKLAEEKAQESSHRYKLL